MAKSAVARTIDLEPIDRLEEKVRLLVDMIVNLRAEQEKAADEHTRLTQEVESLRTRLADAESTNAELSSLRDERDVIRTRVAEMLQQLEAIFETRLSKVVKVEVGGQVYPIRSSLDAKYVGELAAYVDSKLRAASDAAPASDMLGLVVLVALNIADEYFRARDQQSNAHGELNARALQLEQLVDDAIAQVEASKAVNHP